MGTYKYSDETYKQARKLRRDGLGYVSIGNKLGVPKSTVRNWVDDISLTKKQEKKLQANSNKKQSVDECGCKHSLRNYLLRNRKRRCEECERYDWRGEPITLEMHRKVDKSYSDVTKDEVVLLCPNCHSLTNDWRSH
jgi:transposase